MNIFGLGAPELLLIVFLLLLFFGKDKLPGLVSSVGESFRELRRSLSGEKAEDKQSVQATQTNESGDTPQK